MDNKYRLYRLRACWEYKDVEAETAKEASKSRIDPKDDFIPIDDGLILSHWADTDITQKKFYDKAQQEIEKVIHG